jgi:hypothetical protein
MKAALHAIGRSAEIQPLLALGASLHEVDSLDGAQAAARELNQESVMLLLSDEFAEAETEAPAALVLVLPGTRVPAEGGPPAVEGAAGGPAEGRPHAAAGRLRRDPLETTRELVSRSVGVDLIAKSKRMVRRDG